MIKTRLKGFSSSVYFNWYYTVSIFGIVVNVVHFDSKPIRLMVQIFGSKVIKGMTIDGKRLKSFTDIDGANFKIEFE